MMVLIGDKGSIDSTRILSVKSADFTDCWGECDYRICITLHNSKEMYFGYGHFGEERRDRDLKFVLEQLTVGGRDD